MQSCLPQDKRTISPTLHQIHDKGTVVTKVSNMLLDSEADYLVKKAKEKGLDRSTVVGENKYSSVRTSSSSYLDKSEDSVISCIEKRIATVAHQPVANLEPLQVTAYAESQKYDPHHDWFEPGTEGDMGQRTMTVFSYLNTVDEACGGATAFPLLKSGKTKQPLRVYPEKGSAVMWSNKTSKGANDELTLHGGEEMKCKNKNKFGLNAWFRDNPWKQ